LLKQVAHVLCHQTSQFDAKADAALAACPVLTSEIQALDACDLGTAPDTAHPDAQYLCHLSQALHGCWQGPCEEGASTAPQLLSQLQWRLSELLCLLPLVLGPLRSNRCWTWMDYHSATAHEQYLAYAEGQRLAYAGD